MSRRRKTVLRALAARVYAAAEVTAPIDPWLLAARSGFEVRIDPATERAVCYGPLGIVTVPDVDDDARGRELLRVLMTNVLENTRAMPANDENVEALVDVLVEAKHLAAVPAAA